MFLNRRNYGRSLYRHPNDSGEYMRRESRGMMGGGFLGSQLYGLRRFGGALAPGFRRTPFAGSYSGFRIPFRHKSFSRRSRYSPFSASRFSRPGRPSLYSYGRRGGFSRYPPSTYPYIPRSTPYNRPMFSRPSAFGRQSYSSCFDDDDDDWDEPFEDEEDDDYMSGDRSWYGGGCSGGSFTGRSYNPYYGQDSFYNDYDDDDDDDFGDYGSRYGSGMGGMGGMGGMCGMGGMGSMGFGGYRSSYYCG